MLQAGTLDGQGTVASDESRKQLERGVGMLGNEGWVMERLVKLSSRAYLAEFAKRHVPLAAEPACREEGCASQDSLRVRG